MNTSEQYTVKYEYRYEPWTPVASRIEPWVLVVLQTLLARVGPDWFNGA